MAQKNLNILMNTAPEHWENESLETLDLNQMGMTFPDNAVVPGSIWIPLIPSTLSPQKVQHFGEDTPMGRAGQPAEVEPCIVFLASSNAACISGQILHPNGQRIINR
jgi:NAD(P)-dependent dehydrogenase (short-subunit alcohol dehydrogenase family)